jgi:hypothetical protein
MDHLNESRVLHHDAAMEVVEPPISISHFVHALRDYRGVILLSFAGVAIAAAVVLLVVCLLSATQRTTTLAFRLDFEGASEGRFPNGLRFSATDIISSPILLKVFAADQLDRFTSFKDFSQSVFVLESNRAYEVLAADYQARLADPKLTAIDRDRIQKEFEMKRESVSKNEYSINYARMRSAAIPDTVVRRVLVDVLSAWAAYAVNDQHVLDYRVAVLSPQIVDDAAVDPNDYIAAIQVLRSKIYRVLDNIEEIRQLPGAQLARTPTDQMSLEEIKMRLQEIVRYRLEPLVDLVRASGLLRNPTTARFLETQLAYDQRQLKAAQDRTEASRQALVVYAMDQRGLAPSSGQNAEASLTSKTQRPAGETVMPQLSDTFLDRLMALTSQSADTKYRQKLVDEYRDASKESIPLQTVVAYDLQLVREVGSATGGGATIDGASAHAQIVAAQQQVRLLIANVNQIYQVVSRNLNPSAQLFTMTEPPSTRTERAQSLAHLFLYYVLILLLALPVIIVACLLHNRFREEEAAEEYLRAEHARAT